jgi:hypothetical protein
MRFRRSEESLAAGRPIQQLLDRLALSAPHGPAGRQINTLFVKQSFYVWATGWFALLPQRFRDAEERVLLWYRNTADRRYGLVALLKAPTAFVVRPGWWISANDQKVSARLGTFMPNACGYNDDVACGDLHRLSFVSAKTQHSRASRNAQHLMNHRVVVHKIINSVAPSLAPRMGIENYFKGSGRVMLAAKTKHLAVIKKRQLWIVRNVAVVPELHVQRIPVADVGEGLFARRDANACGFFHQAFNRLYLMCFHCLALDRGGLL